MAVPEQRVTDLTAADLRDAKMRDAKLATAFGASANLFGGADLTNAQLPPGIARFEALPQATEALKSVHLVLASLLAACVYIILTYQPVAARMRYPALAHHVRAHGIKIPVVEAEVPPVVFALVAPLIVVALYAFLSALLRRVWLSLAALPAFFIDGTALDEKGYPSPISGLVRRHLHLMQNDTSAILRAEQIATGLVVYGSAPGTLLTLMLFDSVKQVGFWVSGWHTALFVICLVLCATMYGSLLSIVADRRPRAVDRLHDEELRDLFKLQDYLNALHPASGRARTASPAGSATPSP